jgi:hypothetical protein
MTGTCKRCNTKVYATTLSFFNTDEICRDCQLIESHHPKYGEARAAELQACKNGNYNFEGIGLPDDFNEHQKDMTA